MPGLLASLLRLEALHTIEPGLHRMLNDWIDADKVTSYSEWNSKNCCWKLEKKSSDLQNWKRLHSTSSLLTCRKAGQWAVERCSLNARRLDISGISSNFRDFVYKSCCWFDSTAFHPEDIKQRTCMVRSPVIGTLGRTSRERSKMDKCSKLSDCCDFALGRKLFPSSHFTS